MYLANVRKVLSTKARKDVNEYLDKYIQMASGTAYNATLMIVDEYLKKKEGDKFVKPTSIDEYRIKLRKHNTSIVSE